MGPTNVLQKTLTCDGPVGEYRAVVQTGNESGEQSSVAGEYVIGFAQEEIDAEDQERGRGMTVRMLGITRAVSGQNNLPLGPVAVDDEGRVVEAGEGDFVIGRCVTPVAQIDDWTAVDITKEGVFVDPEHTHGG